MEITPDMWNRQQATLHATQSLLLAALFNSPNLREVLAVFDRTKEEVETLYLYSGHPDEVKELIDQELASLLAPLREYAKGS